MADLILPGQSELGLALREPNLLVPGRQPVGAVRVAAINGILQANQLRRCIIADREVNNASLAVSGTVGRIATPNGIAINPGNSGLISTAISEPDHVGLFAVAQFYVNALPNVDKHVFGLGGGSATLGGILAAYTDASNKIIAQYRADDSGTVYLVTGPTIAAGLTYTVVIGVRKVTSVQVRPFLIVNGVDYGISGAGFNGTVRSYVWFASGGLRRTSGVNYGQLPVLLAAYGRIPENDFSVRASLVPLSLDPYSLLEPKNDSPYLLSSAALPTLSSPTAINITSGGFQPRVTATY